MIIHLLELSLIGRSKTVHNWAREREWIWCMHRRI